MFQFHLKVQVGAQILGIWWRNDSKIREHSPNVLIKSSCSFGAHIRSTLGATPALDVAHYVDAEPPEDPRGLVFPTPFLPILRHQRARCVPATSCSSAFSTGCPPGFFYGLMIVTHHHHHHHHPRPRTLSLCSAPNRYASSPNVHAQYIKMKAFITKRFLKACAARMLMKPTMCNLSHLI